MLATDYEAQLRLIRATMKNKKSNIKDRARSKVYKEVKKIADSWRSKKVPQIDVSTRSYDLRAATKAAKAESKKLAKEKYWPRAEQVFQAFGNLRLESLGEDPQARRASKTDTRKQQHRRREEKQLQAFGNLRLKSLGQDPQVRRARKLVSRKQRAENQQAGLSIRKNPRSIQKAMHRIRLQFPGPLTRQAAREYYKARGLQNVLDDASRRQDEVPGAGDIDVASGKT